MITSCRILFAGADAFRVSVVLRRVRHSAVGSDGQRRSYVIASNVCFHSGSGGERRGAYVDPNSYESIAQGILNVTM